MDYIKETFSRTSIHMETVHGLVHKETVSQNSSGGYIFTDFFTLRQFYGFSLQEDSYGRVHRTMFHGQFKETVSRTSTHTETVHGLVHIGNQKWRDSFADQFIETSPYLCLQSSRHKVWEFLQLSQRLFLYSGDLLRCTIYSIHLSFKFAHN
jgi:hypothetical protein